MTTKTKLLTAWTLFCLMFVGCSDKVKVAQTLKTSLESSDILYTTEVHEVTVDGVKYLIVTKHDAVCIIKKEQPVLNQEKTQ